ncbi:class II aldolase and adducin N-terminal domain-containing protein [Gammaproteobacteria bacterium]|nr:class II aldolase and adducin N-terminal domain-containing protein [Gammaproteobacteria bacterium]
MSDYLHQLRVDLSAAFRWAVRLNYHEGVANHFSVAINDSGTQFLINPNARHFSRIRASELLILDVNNQETMVQPNAPDPTAWGLHGAVHKRCSHARCVLHVHSIFSTVLACLKDPRLPAIDQNTAQFYNRVIIDKGFDGMAFEDEGERCAAMLGDPNKKVMVMGNHGVMVTGSSVSDAFNRLFYFERSAETYIRALQTGSDLNFLSDEIAEKTAQQWETYDGSADAHFSELKAILDSEESDYKD